MSDYNDSFHDDDYRYDDFHVSVYEDSIKIYEKDQDPINRTKYKTYSISSINSIEVIEKNTLFSELFAMSFSIAIFFGIIGIIMNMTDASSNSMETLYIIFMGFLTIFVLISIFMHYKNKFFIQITSSSGKENIYFSTDSKKSNDIVKVILAIKNRK
jgi:heme/copper-type cytochrome/quinol oxidase subunit 4